MPTAIKGDKTRVITEQERNSAIKTERLICNSIDQNNNKFWNGYVLSNGDGYAEWGRVGKSSQHEYYAFGNQYDASKWLEDKSYDKQHKGSGKESYTPQRTIPSSGTVQHSSNASTINRTQLKNIAAQQIKGDSETKKLVTWLAEVNVHQITKNTQITYNVNTGTFSTPLGLVTPDGINEARDILSDISSYVKKYDWENYKYKNLLSNYLRIIPQDVGMKRGWHTELFAASDALIKQNDILDSLDAALQGNNTAKSPADSSEQVFNVELVKVNGALLNSIKTKYHKDKGKHSDVADYDVKQAWSVYINTVRSAFQNDGAKLSNIQQLYHGSKSSNVLSILKQGLVIPPSSASHVCSRMWGDGCYTSSDASKALRYSTNAWTSGGNTDRKFMFICAVACGKQHIPTNGSSWGYKLPKGYDSCWAKAGVSGVMNHEQIVYRTSQIDLLYLVEFTPYGK